MNPWPHVGHSPIIFLELEDEFDEFDVSAGGLLNCGKELNCASVMMEIV